MRDERAVVRNEQTSRFELAVAPGQAHLNFHLVGRRLTLVHTEVVAELAGRGIASDLVDAALRFAESAGCTVVAACPFVIGWLERHPVRAAALDLSEP